LRSEGASSCLYFGPAGFAGVWRKRRQTVHCSVQLATQSIWIRYVARGCRLVIPNPQDWISLLPTIPFSPGYGKTLSPEAEREEIPRSSLYFVSD
jgi:hypothetical protein